jgi:hypothetical protein
MLNSVQTTKAKNIVTGSEILVGGRYYKAKAQLLADERSLLRVLACEIITIQPHKILYNFVRVMSSSKKAVQFATCMINDILIHSNVSISFSATSIASAIIKISKDLVFARDGAHKNVIAINHQKMRNKKYYINAQQNLQNSYDLQGYYTCKKELKVFGTSSTSCHKLIGFIKKILLK